MTERIEIPADGFSLEAELHEEKSEDAVVLCHPHPAFGGRLDTPLLVSLADALFSEGRTVVRFNFRGLGRSGGKATGGEAEHEDVIAVCRWLRSRGHARISLVGNSFGALMAVRAMAAGVRAAAYVAIAFPTSILGDDPERIALVRAGVASGTPSLFYSGDRDSLCDLVKLRSWIAECESATLQVAEGEGHFFRGSAERAVVIATSRFLQRALTE